MKIEKETIIRIEMDNTDRENFIKAIDGVIVVIYENDLAGELDFDNTLDYLQEFSDQIN